MHFQNTNSVQNPLTTMQLSNRNSSQCWCYYIWVLHLYLQFGFIFMLNGHSYYWKDFSNITCHLTYFKKPHQMLVFLGHRTFLLQGLHMRACIKFKEKGKLKSISDLSYFRKCFSWLMKDLRYSQDHLTIRAL